MEKLKKKLGSDIAVLARSIAVPNIEYFINQKIAQENGLELAVMSYVGDKFVTANKDKKSYLHYFNFEGFGRSGGYKTRKIKVVNNLNKWDGKRFSEIKIDNGLTISEYHLRGFDNLGEPRPRVIEASGFLGKFKNAQEYYFHYLSLFVGGGRYLVENFEVAGEERFHDEVFMPAYERVKKEYGVYPNILHLPLPEDGSELFQPANLQVLEEYFQKVELQ